MTTRNEETKDYTPCQVEPEKLEMLTQGYGVNEEEPPVFENILLLANPEPTPLNAIEPSASSNVEKLLLFTPKTTKQYSISSEKGPLSTQETYTVPRVAIENELDSIFAKIQINTSKIKYLEAQLYMLLEFYEQAFRDLPPEAKKKVLDYAPNAGNEQRKKVPTPVYGAVEDLECKVSEIKFLLDLVKEYEQRKPSV
jgi:hypothetical protein